MPDHKLNIDVENFPGLDAAAHKRVQEALHRALSQELAQAGHLPGGQGGTHAVFGDGSVKGMPQGRTTTPQRGGGG